MFCKKCGMEVASTYKIRGGREFATFLSAMILFIGYFMVLFTEKRQALHDQLAGTYVLHVG